MSPRVVLVGPPGSGKSTVGRLVAARLGVAFRDTDSDVEATVGKSVADVFVEDGEPRFRALERTAVRRALAEHDGVLALGGGAVADPDTRRLLRGQVVVLLDVRFSGAVRRVGLNRDRPLLLDNPRATLRRLMDERRPLYEEVARVVVPTDDRSAEDVAATVVDAVAGSGTAAP